MRGKAELALACLPGAAFDPEQSLLSNAEPGM
jgi:hypothetical protein